MNLNTCNVRHLQLLPKIGEKSATAIIQRRTELGLFQNWSEVDAIPGVGVARLNVLQQRCTILPPAAWAPQLPQLPPPPTMLQGFIPLLVPPIAAVQLPVQVAHAQPELPVFPEPQLVIPAPAPFEMVELTQALPQVVETTILDPEDDQAFENRRIAEMLEADEEEVPQIAKRVLRWAIAFPVNHSQRHAVLTKCLNICEAFYVDAHDTYDGLEREDEEMFSELRALRKVFRSVTESTVLLISDQLQLENPELQQSESELFDDEEGEEYDDDSEDEFDHDHGSEYDLEELFGDRSFETEEPIDYGFCFDDVEFTYEGELEPEKQCTLCLSYDCDADCRD